MTRKRLPGGARRVHKAKYRERYTDRYRDQDQQHDQNEDQDLESDQHLDSNKYQDADEYLDSNQYQDAHQYLDSNQYQDADQDPYSNQYQGAHQYLDSNQYQDADQYPYSNQYQGAHQNQDHYQLDSQAQNTARNSSPHWVPPHSRNAFYERVTEWDDLDKPYLDQSHTLPIRHTIPKITINQLEILELLYIFAKSPTEGRPLRLNEDDRDVNWDFWRVTVAFLPMIGGLSNIAKQETQDIENLVKEMSNRAGIRALIRDIGWHSVLYWLRYSLDHGFYLSKVNLVEYIYEGDTAIKDLPLFSTIPYKTEKAEDLDARVQLLMLDCSVERLQDTCYAVGERNIPQLLQTSKFESSEQVELAIWRKIFQGPMGYWIRVKHDYIAARELASEKFSLGLVWHNIMLARHLWAHKQIVSLTVLQKIALDGRIFTRLMCDDEGEQYFIMMQRDLLDLESALTTDNQNSLAALLSEQAYLGNEPTSAAFKAAVGDMFNSRGHRRMVEGNKIEDAYERYRAHVKISKRELKQKKWPEKDLTGHNMESSHEKENHPELDHLSRPPATPLRTASTPVGIKKKANPSRKEGKMTATWARWNRMR